MAGARMPHIYIDLCPVFPSIVMEFKPWRDVSGDPTMRSAGESEILLIFRQEAEVVLHLLSTFEQLDPRVALHSPHYSFSG